MNYLRNLFATERTETSEKMLFNISVNSVVSVANWSFR
jgi:hypothetical protein